MPRHHKKKRGGGIFGSDDPNTQTWSQWASKYTPSVFKKTEALSPPPLVAGPVAEVTTAAQTAGRRIKKHLGVNPMSPKDARKLLKTAKGDRMLGGKRRKTRRH